MRDVVGYKIYETAKIADRTKLLLSRGAVIGDFTFIACKELEMGEGACINRFTEVQGREKVTMGRHAVISSHCSIMTSTDTPWGCMSDSAEEEFRRIKTAPVVIGDEAFIGAHVTIMPGVTIGNGAVVGAYSYVSKDIPPMVISRPPKQKMVVGARKTEFSLGLEEQCPEEIVMRKYNEGL